MLADFTATTEEIETEWGRFGIKISVLPNESKKVKPDSDELLKIAYKKNINPNIMNHKIIGKYEKDN